jgi:hypothetical protein
MKELIGKKITGLRINEDQSILAFDTDQGVVAYATYGDCCSETWFADITGVSALIGGTVHTADEVSMDGYNVEDGRTRQYYDEVYGVKLTTDKGYADIVFRNSSNGYYGGWIGLLKRDLPAGMTAIEDDWHA